MSNPLDRVFSGPSIPPVRHQVMAGGPGSVLERSGQEVRLRAPAPTLSVKQKMEAGSITDAHQTVNVTVGLEPRYFDMTLVPAGDEGAVAQLRPGTTYRVRVRPRDNPATPPVPEYVQNPIRVRASISLSLEAAPAADGDDVELDHRVVAYSPGEADGWTGEFRLGVPDGYACSTLTLHLRYWEGPGEAATATVRSYPVQAGAGRPRGVAVSHALGLGDVPPPRTAVLYLSYAAEGQILASGFMRDRANRPHESSLALPARPPGPFRSAATFVAAMRDAMDDFARGITGGIGPWLEEVLRLYGDQCCLMITDDTGSATPWELFRLPDGTRLGARARVVRWVNVVYRDRPISWANEPARVSERIAAYIPADDALSVLARIPNLGAAVQRFEDQEDLEDALLDAADEGEPVGFVYLAAQGSLAHDHEEEALLAGLDPSPPRTARFRLREVEGKLNPRPLVFANTPYSAQVPRAGSRIYGFACAMLTQVASGYIGTLGPVDPEHAASFAERIFARAARQEVWPAELLRELRAEALLAYQDRGRARSREQRDAELLAFLYVYYGNPGVSIGAGRGDA